MEDFYLPFVLWLVDETRGDISPIAAPAVIPVLFYVENQPVRDGSEDDEPGIAPTSGEVNV